LCIILLPSNRRIRPQGSYLPGPQEPMEMAAHFYDAKTTAILSLSAAIPQT
jgi:hypothetical protein